MKSLLAAVCLLFSFAILGQVSITGKIVEEGTGEALPFATILIEGTNIGTTTNLDGFFSLLDLPNKKVTLKVSYVGYENLLLEYDPNNPPEKLSISLKPLSNQLEEVVVSATAYKVMDASSGISTTKISTKQLALLPNVGETDIFRSLQLLPGVSGTNENSSGLFVRGGTPDQNLVLLDGMTVYKVDHFFGFFSAFNANAIKDVQLFKGAFPSKYGGRTSSVVDMTGKTGSFEKVGGAASINFLSANAYIELPITKNLSFLAAGRRSYTDIIQSGLFDEISDNLIGDGGFDNANVDEENVTIVEPEFYFFDWNSKLSYRPSDKDMITLSLYNGKDFLDESRTLDQEFPLGENPGRIILSLAENLNWGNRGISTKWSRQWNPKFYSNVLVAGSEYFSEYDRDAFLEVSIPAEDSIIGAGSRLTVEDNSVIDVTGRADFEWQNSNTAKTEFGFSFTNTKVEYSSIRDDTVTILERNQEAQFGSVYAGHERKWNGLTFNVGTRLSKYRFRTSPLFEPRLNIAYQLTSKVKLKGAFGIHYQFVNQIVNENLSEGSREFWLLADGEDVKISKAIHYVLGGAYEIDNWLFDVEGFYKDYSGLSEFSLRFRRGLEIEANELFFTGDGIARGVEFLIQKKQGRYTGWVSYTLSRVKNTFADFNEGLEFPALHDQLHEFKMLHSYEIGRWTLASTFIYGSGKPFSEPEGQYSIELLDGRTIDYIGVGSKNGSRLPEYHRLDFSVHRKFDVDKWAKGDIGLSVFNLYGRQNVWYVEYDFNQDPAVISSVNYLGFTPNLSLSIQF